MAWPEGPDLGNQKGTTKTNPNQTQSSSPLGFPIFGACCWQQCCGNIFRLIEMRWRLLNANVCQQFFTDAINNFILVDARA